MSRTLGYHVVVSCYGLWLPGDQRGSWSEAWDKRIGFIEPHTLHLGDPIRRQMAEERMKHPPVRLNAAMINLVAQELAACRAESEWKVAAASIESTHTHLLLTYSERSIDNTIKWLKDRWTKAIHSQTSHSGPVWCKGRWRQFIYDDSAWEAIRQYIERHNERRGAGPWPYSFITPP